MIIETVGELLAALEEFDEDAPVRVAQQPSYPLAAVVNCVTELGPDDEEEQPARPRPGERVVWIATSEVTSYHEHPYAPREAWQ